MFEPRTLSWLYSQIILTGRFDPGAVRVFARDPHRAKHAQNLFNLLPPWERDEIFEQYAALGAHRRQR